MKTSFLILGVLGGLAISSHAQTNPPVTIFPKLLSLTNSVLITNAEFRCAVGDRMWFRDPAGHYLRVNAEQVNSNVLAKLHFSLSAMIADQQRREAKDAAYRQEMAAATAQQAIFEQQQILQQRRMAEVAAGKYRSLYTGLNPDGSGKPNFSNPDNASRKGWDGKHYHDNQSEGNFIGN